MSALRTLDVHAFVADVQALLADSSVLVTGLLLLFTAAFLVEVVVPGALSSELMADRLYRLGSTLTSLPSYLLGRNTVSSASSEGERELDTLSGDDEPAMDDAGTYSAGLANVSGSMCYLNATLQVR